MLLYIYPERAGIPGLERDCHSSLGSSGDISIPHSGVSRGHVNVPLQSDHRYTPTPDSSGLRGFPNRTSLRSDQALPKYPTSPSDILNGVVSVHLRTTLIYSPTFHKHYSEWNSLSPHRALPTHQNITNINSAYIFQQVWITPFIGSNAKTRLSPARTYSRLPDCLVSPLEAATGKGGNHSWQPTRQPSQPRTTVYKLVCV